MGPAFVGGGGGNIGFMMVLHFYNEFLFFFSVNKYKPAVVPIVVLAVST